MDADPVRTQRPPLAWRPLLLVSLGVALLQALVANRHGFHRDELYFIEAGQHLAVSYIDQPPFVPALARIQQALFGASPWALRVLPALVGAAVAPLAGAIARELGGRRRAQVLAGAAVATSGFVLTIGHLLATATFDFVLWLVLLLVLTRLLRTGRNQLWLVYGAVAGVALWNKHLPVLLSLAVVLALIADRRWELLRSRRLVSGGALAVLIASPLLVWQAANGWPQLQMAGALSERIGGENRVTLLPLQLLMLGPFLVPMGVIGARWLWRDRSLRPLATTYPIALALTLLSGGRPYYPLPIAAALIVAGAVALEQRVAASEGAPTIPRWAPALVVANLVMAIPLSLPVLPERVLGDTPVGDINDTLVETVGWPELATQVAAVVDDLPPGQRANVVILTGSYGEAGALDLFGPALGLPEPYSGHNSYADWRVPTEDDATVVAVRLPTAYLDRWFEGCVEVASVDNGFGVDNEAQGAPITVCTRVLGGWAARWDDLRHVS